MTMIKILQILQEERVNGWAAAAVSGLLWPTLHHNELPSDLSSHRHDLQPLCSDVQVALGEKKTSLRGLGK